MYKFQLSPGQQAPPNSTGQSLGDWIVLESATWPSEFDVVTHQEMTANEVSQFYSAKYRDLATAEILDLYTEAEQREMLARSSELIEAKVAGTITAEEEAELDQIKSVRAQIKAIQDKHVASAAAAIAAAT